MLEHNIYKNQVDTVPSLNYNNFSFQKIYLQVVDIEKIELEPFFNITAGI